MNKKYKKNGELTKVTKILLIKKMLKNEIEMEFGLCVLYRDILDIPFSCTAIGYNAWENVVMRHMEVGFPELYKEIHKRQERRRSGYAWKRYNIKYRVRFLNNFLKRL